MKQEVLLKELGVAGSLTGTSKKILRVEIMF